MQQRASNKMGARAAGFIPAVHTAGIKPAARGVVILALAFVVMLLAGCGQADGLVPVSGKVSIDNKPLAAGSVCFHPDAGKGTKATVEAVGVIDSQGNYKLVSGAKEGAAPGWYKVTVTAQEKFDAKDPYALPKHLINAKFSDPHTSGLTIQVVERPTAGAYDIKVTK